LSEPQATSATAQPMPHARAMAMRPGSLVR
jgi:hypothetical protein